jgi:hypothetical protein
MNVIQQPVQQPDQAKQLAQQPNQPAAINFALVPGDVPGVIDYST